MLNNLLKLDILLEVDFSEKGITWEYDKNVVIKISKTLVCFQETTDWVGQEASRPPSRATRIQSTQQSVSVSVLPFTTFVSLVIGVCSSK